MSDRTLLALLRDDTLTLYSMNGAAASELAKLRVHDVTPDGIASLVQGLAPFLAKPAALVKLPKPTTGILAARPGPPLESGRPRQRQYNSRMPMEARAAQLRAMVDAHPEGIRRTELLQSMGLQNPSGTQWKRVVEEAGVRVVKVGAGQTGYSLYFPGDSTGPDDGT